MTLGKRQNSSYEFRREKRGNKAIIFHERSVMFASRNNGNLFCFLLMVHAIDVVFLLKKYATYRKKHKKRKKKSPVNILFHFYLENHKPYNQFFLIAMFVCWYLGLIGELFLMRNIRY
jgi:hypothetical protein